MCLALAPRRSVLTFSGREFRRRTVSAHLFKMSSLSSDIAQSLGMHKQFRLSGAETMPRIHKDYRHFNIAKKGRKRGSLEKQINWSLLSAFP